MNPLFKLDVGMTPEQHTAFINNIKAVKGVMLNDVKGEVRYTNYMFKYAYNDSKLTIECLSTPKGVSRYALLRKITELIPKYVG